MSDPKRSKDAEDILAEFKSSLPPKEAAAQQPSAEPPAFSEQSVLEPAKEGPVAAELSESARLERPPPWTAREGLATAEPAAAEPQPAPEPAAAEPQPAPDQGPAGQAGQKPAHPGADPNQERNVIFVGTKTIMVYLTATLTQLASQDVVTIKARGKRITQAVDVSQMIVKRMDTVGYVISDVRIASDSLTSQDGKERRVSTIEIDIAKT